MSSFAVRDVRRGAEATALALQRNAAATKRRSGPGVAHSALVRTLMSLYRSSLEAADWVRREDVPIEPSAALVLPSLLLALEESGCTPDPAGGAQACPEIRAWLKELPSPAFVEREFWNRFEVQCRRVRNGEVAPGLFWGGNCLVGWEKWLDGYTRKGEAPEALRELRLCMSENPDEPYS